MKDTRKHLLGVKKKILSSPGWLFFRHHKKLLAVIILIGFTVFLITYLWLHPDLLIRVFQIGWKDGLLLLILYLGVVLTNIGITQASVRLCHKNLPLQNGFLLTIYSTIVNFFGPLQSGPGVRAVYLKQKIKLRLRDYTLAMLVYYFLFGALSVSLLFMYRLAWLSLLGIIATIVIMVVGSRLAHLRFLRWQVYLIFIYTLIQIIITACIYGIELRTVQASGYSFSQVLSYTASANLAMFVSITPGAIGIREAFLVFAQSLHGISTASILAAGLLDRAFYVIFLVVLFLGSSGLHLKKLFKTNR